MRKMLLFGLLLISGFAKSQNRLSLDSIFAAIAANNPKSKMYDADIRSMDESAKGARNWDAPLVSSGLWMTPYNPNLWKRQSDGSTGMGQYMISVQQMFPNVKNQDAQEKYMLGVSAAEKERKKSSFNEQTAAAKQNYYAWLIIRKKIAILDENENLLDFMIKNTELRYKNNLGKVSAYYKLKASLGNIENMRIQFENEIEQKKIALNTLMNRDKTTDFEIDTGYIIKVYPESVFDSSSLTYGRSDIRAIDKEIQLTALQQQAEISKLKPEFGIRYDQMFGFGGLPMQYSLMGMVRLPMFKWSSKASKANVEGLQWKAVSLEQQKIMMINEATGMAQGMKREISTKQKQIRLFEEKIIPSLRRNFQTMQLGYEQNTEELFELYDAWETLNMTQLEYLDQVQQLLQMQIELDRILEIK